MLRKRIRSVGLRYRYRLQALLVPADLAGKRRRALRARRLVLGISSMVPSSKEIPYRC